MDGCGRESRDAYGMGGCALVHATKLECCVFLSRLASHLPSNPMLYRS